MLAGKSPRWRVSEMYRAAPSIRWRSVMTAARTSADMAATPRKVCASWSRSSRSNPANEPWSLAVSGIAKEATTRLAATAPGCQKRSAAQIMNGNTRNPRGTSS
jgi:hypothetical protein